MGRERLPVQLSTFVGRRAEITELRRLAAENRLVTLVGGPGLGKSRLAIQLAPALAPAGSLGYVSVATIDDPRRLALQIAAALDLSPDHLLAELRSRASLLVLDGCEHLVDAAAEVVDGLLRQCPRLTVLATSREPLGVPGELTFRVPPLGAAEARELFLQRLALARPDLRLTEADHRLVAEICERLDGVALALELAAVRLRTMSLEDVHARLSGWLQLLTGGARTGAPRQKTMRAAIEWSHDLLERGEQAALARLSVFAGSFGLGAAEAVCGFRPLTLEAVLPALTGLIEKSLVVHSPAGYHLPETVRQFAAERLLDAGEEADARALHADFYTLLAERGGAGPAEAENLAAALGWSHRCDSDRYLRLTAALGPYWLARGELAEGQVRLQSALDLPGGPAPARAAALEESRRIAEAAEAVRPEDLTGREVEIARLVAEGLTNRQIAARLYLSVRTVEGHVEHLRNKLGFATRARVAAWVSEKQVATK